jgi:hypothetical protein
MEVFLLNVMGSAALASAVIAGIITTRLSREISGSSDSHLDAPRKGPGHNWIDDKP